jgi:hypothetical protein
MKINWVIVGIYSISYGRELWEDLKQTAALCQ